MTATGVVVIPDDLTQIVDARGTVTLVAEG